MNADHQIYELVKDADAKAAREDVARLDGYLHGRAEASTLNRAQRRKQLKARRKRKHGRPR